MEHHVRTSLTPDGYLARFCQNLAKTVYLARSGRKMVILQDLPEKWLSCKICQKTGCLARFLQVRSGRAVRLLAPLHATHFILIRNLLKNQLRFFKKNNKF